MKIVLPIISYLALALVIVPAILYLTGSMDKPLMKTIMLVGTLAWFVSVPFWMGRKQS